MPAPTSGFAFVRFSWIPAAIGCALAWMTTLSPGLTATPASLTPYESAQPLTPRGKIDRQVFSRWEALGVKPARPVSEAAFLRRVYLDVIGRLPTADEARRYLADTAVDKRATLIDRLLARPEFADYWTLKWSDLLRVKAEYPINLWPNAAQAYHRWIYDAVRTDKPLDQFARELLVSSGSNVHAGAVNFYRAVPGREPLALAKTVALTFLGTRDEAWSAEQWTGLAGFFSQVGYKSTGEWKEEIVFWDPGKAIPTGAAAPRFPDGTAPALRPDQDPRVVVADWLLAPENPWFARVMANRIWSWVMGRGVVHEPDDFRPGNPPSHPELLQDLADELVASHYSLKHLFRLILTSQVYQLSCVPGSDDPRAAALFAHYPLRRLEAEVLIDALNDLTGTSESYSSAIPEPYTFIPADVRAVSLPDGSISSSFLELFGRPARDSGLESERNNRITAGQRLHLLNSSHVRRKLEQGPRLSALLRGPPAGMLDAIYLAVLSRHPTDDERRLLRTSLKPAGGGGARTAATDLVWALVNSDEFLHRH
ncbi:MAG: DUF1553 domain-containing protein [Opitutaceae bacterium]|nr:DUF1553 domain-containing protein [Opitutaceae bacterium]